MSVKSRSWSSDVRAAIKIFGKDHVVKALRVPVSAIDGWLKDGLIPDQTSSIRNRLNTLLGE